MSHKPNGARTHHCPWCGESYQFTNWMKRYDRTEDGKILPDTHQIACYKKRHCHAGKDGECNWKNCPQNRDGEPGKTGRHCPLDNGIDPYE